jgi:hypothetical protein
MMTLCVGGFVPRSRDSSISLINIFRILSCEKAVKPCRKGKGEDEGYFEGGIEGPGPQEEREIEHLTHEDVLGCAVCVQVQVLAHPVLIEVSEDRVEITTPFRRNMIVSTVQE